METWRPLDSEHMSLGRTLASLTRERRPARPLSWPAGGEGYGQRRHPFLSGLRWVGEWEP